MTVILAVMVLMVKLSTAAKKSIRQIGESMNLLTETVQSMTAHGKSANDIAWIGGKDFYISPEDFFFSAKDVDYDCGYGSAEVATDLVVAFKDGSWLSRGEYDGSEFWRYNSGPQRPEKEFKGKVKFAASQFDDYFSYVYSSLYKMNS
jgi:hypothetical protein